jgi:hypothetical protein
MSVGGRHEPHAVVKHELLVRYLDAWIPAHKKALFVSWAGVAGAQVALRVFAEFADLLVGHPARMLVPAGVSLADLTPVPGVVVSVVDGPLTVPAKGMSVFGWFDHRSSADVSTVAGVAGAEVLAAGPDVTLDMPLSCRVELVAASGEAERLVFGTSAEKSLERFKEELWALDEYAGIRFRDPADADGGLSDISVVAHLGPLRRTLLRQLAGVDGMTVASLRTWTLRETVFRAGDATRAVQALLTAGSVTRDPPGGRLSTDTLIRAVSATMPPAADPESST